VTDDISPPGTATSPADDRRQLAAFIEGARWFGGKGRDGVVTDVRRLGMVAEHGPRVVVDLAEVTYPDGDVEVYQVPLALYTDPQHRLDHAFVGWWEDPEVGWTHAYDAVHDREAMAAYLRAFAYPPDGPLTFHRLPGEPLDPSAHSTPFTGEQSNSSVAFGEQALLKVFRRVTPGVNPDIEIHDVLTRAGSDNVAALYGWIEARDFEAGGFETGARAPSSTTGAPGARAPSSTTGAPGARAPSSTTGVPGAGGHSSTTGAPGAGAPSSTTGGQPPSTTGGGPLQLGMLQQFLRTASDGWELALTSVRNLFAEADLYADEVGGDFAGEAQRLGEAVSRIHALLAEHFPTVQRTAADHRSLADAMTARLEAALPVVPELEPHADHLRGLFAAVATIGEDTAQRVHGDLHLGQTLRTAKGWKIVDFEGEPAKPLSERVAPDSPWRDVAGMLRSFDYAPRVAQMTAAATGDDGSEQRAYRAAEWSARNQAAFLEAYAGRALTGDEQTLLTAYVADKAVYECVYEARNRPTWLSIPMAALSSTEGNR
jgi:maltokinase